MGKPKSDDKADVPMSSMIDIVFLLLIFFIATAEMDKEAFEGDVVLARCESMAPVTQVSPIMFMAQIEEDGSILVNGNKVDQERCKALLVTHQKQYGSKAEVVIRAHQNAELKYTEMVMTAAMDAQLPTVKIVAEMREKE